MNPQVWWYVARGSGVTAWLLLTASIVFGIVLTAGLFPKHRRPAWLLDLHRALGGLTVCFVAVHIGALIADNFVHFDIVDALVPFASSWKTWQVAIGVLALWGLVAVEVTSLAMKRLSRATWHAVHLTSYVVFVLTSLHGTFAGTDAHNRLYLWSSIIVTLVLMAAVTYRILARSGPRPRATAGARPKDITTSPPWPEPVGPPIRSIPGEPLTGRH